MAVKSVLVTVPEHVGFQLHNGKLLTSIKQLASELKAMSDQDYSAFVNTSKNDFASWVEHVFKDKSLAAQIKKAQSRTNVVSLLNKQLAPKKTPVKTVQKSVKKAIKAVTPKEQKRKIKTEEEEHQQLNIHQQIKHLETHLDKLLKFTPRQGSTDPVTADIKDRLVDFSFGLVIGLVMGFVLARSIGLL